MSIVLGGPLTLFTVLGVVGLLLNPDEDRLGGEQVAALLVFAAYPVAALVLGIQTLRLRWGAALAAGIVHCVVGALSLLGVVGAYAEVERLQRLGVSGPRLSEAEWLLLGTGAVAALTLLAGVLSLMALPRIRAWHEAQRWRDAGGVFT
jgi:hypothetical protein